MIFGTTKSYKKCLETILHSSLSSSRKVRKKSENVRQNKFWNKQLTNVSINVSISILCTQQKKNWQPMCRKDCTKCKVTRSIIHPIRMNGINYKEEMFYLQEHISFGYTNHPTHPSTIHICIWFSGKNANQVVQSYLHF